MIINTNISGILRQPISNKAISPATIIESIKFKNKILGDLFLKETDSTCTNQNWKKFSIFNKLEKELGYEILNITPEEKYITGANIFVIEEYRRKFGLGEVLRLCSIMHMIENKKDAIKICAKDSAVYFHSKYGFIPDFKDFYARDRLLEGIRKDKAFPELAKKAAALLQRVLLHNEKEQRAVCKEANNLLKRYIELAQQNPHPEKNHKPAYSVDMILKKEDVIKNKEFYNNLLEKNFIDYKI